VLTFMTIAYFFISTINIGVYLYTPELYPTRVRALAVGVATAWLRLASIIGPTAVGMMIASGLPAVFVTFAAVPGSRLSSPVSLPLKHEGACWRRLRRSGATESTAAPAPISTLAKGAAALQRGVKIDQTAKPATRRNACAYRD